ncbi:MAG: hypothetical protein V4739_19065 [Pseudomonadota bacterium]
MIDPIRNPVPPDASSSSRHRAAVPTEMAMLLSAGYEMLRSVPDGREQQARPVGPEDRGKTPFLFTTRSAGVEGKVPPISGTARHPPAQHAALAAGIRAATLSDAGANTHAGFNPLDPQTLTPLQRLLLQAVKEISPAELASSPDLLAAVQAGFQTAGGRQLALECHILDAGLVGDLTRPVTGASTGSSRRRLAETAHPINATFKFNKSIPPDQLDPVKALLRSIADNSPTLRNILALALKHNGRRIEVRVDPHLRNVANFNGTTATITLRSFEEAKMAVSSIVFEANNAAILPELRGVRSDDVFLRGGAFLPGYAEQLDRQACDILKGGLQADPQAMAAFVKERIAQPDIQAEINAEVARHNGQGSRGSNVRLRARTIQGWKAKIVRDLQANSQSLRPYLAQKYDARKLREATHFALRTEHVETESVFNHLAVFAELKSASDEGTLVGEGKFLLDLHTIANLDIYRSAAPTPRGLHGPVTVEQARLNDVSKQVRLGHTYRYMEQHLVPRRWWPFFQWEPLETAIDADEAAGATAELRAQGEAAGKASRAAIHSVVEGHGPGNHAAKRAATEATLRAESLTLAEHLLNHPKLASALKTTGKVLTVAAVAVMTYQLGEAIYKDIQNGDRQAHATRKVLAELLVGLAGAELGALGGAATGAAVGTWALPGIGTIVGAFVGGLLGGGLGFKAGSAAGDAAYGVTQSAVDAVIDQIAADGSHAAPGTLGQLLAAPRKKAVLIVQAGSKDDGLVNAGELRAGIESLGGTLSVSDEQIGRLVNAYDAAGVGALTVDDLERAIRDEALVVDASGALTVDPYPFSVNLSAGGQETQAAHIAQRLVNLGSGDEGDDRRLNAGELVGALEEAGYEVLHADGDDGGWDEGADKDEMARMLAAYDASGDAAVTEGELALAIRDGALTFTTEGEVLVDTSRILGQSGEQSAHLALRIVRAGSQDGAWRNADELQRGLERAGFDDELSDEDIDALIARYGKDGVGAIGVAGLKQAIDDGVLVLHPNGAVRFDATAG